jgi:hypothetical protein
MHRDTYTKGENLILNLNQRTPSTFGYQAGRDTYMMWKILCEYIVPIYSVCTCRNMELIVNNKNGILYGKSRFRYVSRNGTGP